MKLKNVGAHDALEVDLPSGGLAVVERDGEFDFPRELAESLLEQEANWAPADDAARKALKKIQTAREEAAAAEIAPETEAAPEGEPAAETKE